MNRPVHFEIHAEDPERAQRFYEQLLDHLRLAGWHGTRQLCRMVVAELAGRPRPTGLTTTLPRPLEPHAASLHLWLDGLTLQAASVPELLPPAAVRREVHREVRAIRSRVAD